MIENPNLEEAVTTHRLIQGDARYIPYIQDESIHLVVTSPPYWTLKRYNENLDQLGHIVDYEKFLEELTKTWKEMFRVLVPGGRLVCIVGDVCLSRRNFGRHVVVPLHADICVICRKIGFDNLNPIIWHKIANANYEVNNGTKFLGKPYEPNAIIKNDIEFILMQRKPGGYRKPTEEQRQLSMIGKKEYEEWFRQFWTINGASTKKHPAPFPFELAYRLVRMFSFWGDTVLDPFAGTGTTMLAAMKCGRNSIGVEKEVKVIETVEVEKVVEVEKEVEKEVFTAVSPVLYNSYQSDPEPRKFIESVVADWNKAHADVPVDLSIIAHEDFKQALRAYLTADPAPDVLDWFAGNRARFFIDKGLILDISDMWKENKFDELYAPGFQALATYNDKQYFMPSSYYWWAIYYRPSLFEKAGISQTPETWDQLLESCDKLNEAGITPITIGARFKWPAAAWFDYLNMRTNGPEFHIDLMDLKVPYNDERVKKTFAHWTELLDHKCFIEDPAAFDWQEAVDPMVQGEAAMYLMGGFIIDSYPDEAENDLDFFRFPVIDPAIPIGEDAPTDGYFMSANAKNAEAGQQFLAYLGSKEIQQRLLDELKRLPTRTDVDISKATEPTQKGIKFIQSADYIAQFYDRDTTPPMAEAGMDGFMRFWDDPASIDQILDELEAERQRILEEATE